MNYWVQKTSASQLVVRALVAVATCALLSSCRVDSVVTLNVQPNGSGTLAIVSTADAEVVAKVPTLASDLSFDDAIAAGWSVSDVVTTGEGAMQVRVAHRFANPQEATALLGQLSGEFGPFKGLTLTRTGKDADSTWNFAGQIQVNDGLNAFADPQLLTTIGASPYQATLANSGLDIGQAVGVTFKLQLPGKVESTTGLNNFDTLQWNVTFDGSTQDLATTTQNTAVAATIAQIVSPLLRWMLILWIVGMVGFSAIVALWRFRRNKRTPTL
ncbi:MAG: hypothetical protein D4R44_02150 [Actinobacteria bacterium]|nr:MAG: hypothetical protein D4R44_02150 [Actinomycetota bacterium]